MIRYPPMVEATGLAPQDLIDQLRLIPLDQVFQAFQFRQNPADKARWTSPHGDYSLREGHFFDLDLRTGGNDAIALVMHMARCDKHEASRFLLKIQSGQELMLSDLDWIDRTHPRLQLLLPEISVENWPKLVACLSGALRIPRRLLNSLQAQSQLYASKEGHVVMVMRGADAKPVGAEIISLRADGSAAPISPLVRGSRRDLGAFFISPMQSPKRAVLLRNGLDAMAWASFFGDDTAISIANTANNKLCDWMIPRLMGQGIEVHSCLGSTLTNLPDARWLQANYGVRPLNMLALHPDARSVLDALRLRSMEPGPGHRTHHNSRSAETETTEVMPTADGPVA